MSQARQIHNIAQGVKSKLQSTDNSLIQSTHSTTSEGFTAEQKRKAILFFDRLRLIYGHRFAVHWPDEETVILARREWAKDLDVLTWGELESALDRAKARLMAGDGDFYWPDVGRIVGLAKEKRTAAYHVFERALPVGREQIAQRRKAGRKGMVNVRALLGGAYAE